jgi:hypothetical protein
MRREKKVLALYFCSPVWWVDVSERTVNKHTKKKKKKKKKTLKQRRDISGENPL